MNSKTKNFINRVFKEFTCVSIGVIFIFAIVILSFFYSHQKWSAENLEVAAWALIIIIPFFALFLFFIYSAIDRLIALHQLSSVPGPSLITKEEFNKLSEQLINLRISFRSVMLSATVFVAAVGFIGYKSYSDMHDKIAKDATSSLSKRYDSLQNRANIIDNELTRINSTMYKRDSLMNKTCASVLELIKRQRIVFDPCSLYVRFPAGQQFWEGKIILNSKQSGSK